MYGFAADPSITKWENAKIHLGEAIIQQYFSKIENRAAHNLCTILTPPQNVEKFLGLGLNICIQERHPLKKFVKSMERMRINMFEQSTYFDTNKMKENMSQKFTYLH